jgi:phage terminase small subunit
VSNWKPTSIKRLEGNPGCRNLEERGVEGLGVPFAPEHLPDDARGCIDVIKASMPADVYSRLDSFLLAAFGMAWAIHKKAAHEIGNPDFEWTVSTRRSQAPSPWLRILNQQAAVMASLSDRLGLNPKARAALHLPDARQQKSKFDGLIGRAGSLPFSSN